MQKLMYKGSWFECLYGWDGEAAIVVDESGLYSRHSHFVQSLRRHVGDKYIVFSRKQTCYITRR